MSTARGSKPASARCSITCTVDMSRPSRTIRSACRFHASRIRNRGYEEVRAELHARYDDWCDSKLGILGLRTPREMTTDPVDRFRVELLLRIYDDVEAAAAKTQERETVSFDFLRERLGLPMASRQP